MILNRQQELSNDLIYSKLSESDEKSSPVLKDASENFQDEKEAL